MLTDAESCDLVFQVNFLGSSAAKQACFVADNPKHLEKAWWLAMIEGVFDGYVCDSGAGEYL